MKPDEESITTNTMANVSTIPMATGGTVSAPVHGGAPVSGVDRVDDEIMQLREDLYRAYRRIDQLNVEKLTIWKVIQRGKYDEQLQIVDTHTTPQGVVVVVS